jgi:hypothetical protein
MGRDLRWGAQGRMEGIGPHPISRCVSNNAPLYGKACYTCNECEEDQDVGVPMHSCHLKGCSYSREFDNSKVICFYIPSFDPTYEMSHRCVIIGIPTVRHL